LTAYLSVNDTREKEKTRVKRAGAILPKMGMQGNEGAMQLREKEKKTLLIVGQVIRSSTDLHGDFGLVCLGRT